MKRLFIIVIICLVITGCGLKSGRVFDKYYSPAHATTSVIPAGKACVPITQYYSESWHLQIVNNHKTDDWEVSKEVYNKYQIGDYVEQIQGGI